MQYGLTVLLSNLIGLIVVLTVAWLLDILLSTAVVVLTLFVLRPSAGGAHCTSAFRCNVLGFFITPILGYVVILLENLVPTLNFVYQITALLVVIPAIIGFAPYYTREKPVVEARKKLLKARALVLALLLFFTSLLLFFRGHALWNLGISTGLLWQGLMLSPPGVQAVNLYEQFFNKFLSKKEVN